MERIKSHIPPAILVNPNASNFARVLDGVQDMKDEKMSVYDGFLDWKLNKEPGYLRRFYYEHGQLPIFTSMPVRCQERMLEKSHEIFGQKGSLNGLKLFVASCCEGTVEVDMSDWWPSVMLIPDDRILGYLPNGSDLTTAINSPKTFPFLFAGTFSYYYTKAIINIKSDLLIGEEEYRHDIALFIPEMLPMCDPATSQITINFYDNANNLLETVNL